MGHLLGIDISTTATKAVLVDATGGVVATSSCTYECDRPLEGWSEQDPEVWWQATIRAIRKVLSATDLAGAAVEGIGLTGQMHGAVLLNVRGEVLRPAILWNDQRTEAQTEAIRERIGLARLIEIAGNDVATGFTAPKLLWVREHEPDVWNRISQVLLPKDYVRYRLTGAFVTDLSDGSGTLLIDLHGRTWSDEIVSLLGLERAWLPPVVEGPTVVAEVSSRGAAATGLSVGTPVVAGGGDQAANAVGVGVVRNGDVALSLGTSGVVFAATEQPVVDPRGRVHAFCHAVPDRWHLMGVMLSAAGSIRWFRDTVAAGVGYDELLAPAADVAPGSDGLTFLPYLTGERTPHSNPHVRGAFVGLSIGHGRAHLTRAVLEGVAFGLLDGLDLIEELTGRRVTRIRASGGGLRNPLWIQIIADVLDAELQTLSTIDGAAYGAGLLAGVGADWFPSVDDATSLFVTPRTSIEPGPDRDRYGEARERYRSIYPAVARLPPG